MKQLIRATFDFDFTLFCAGASGVFASFTLVHLVMADFYHAIVSSSCAAVLLVGALYGRKIIKSAIDECIQLHRRENQ